MFDVFLYESDVVNQVMNFVERVLNVRIRIFPRETTRFVIVIIFDAVHRFISTKGRQCFVYWRFQVSLVILFDIKSQMLFYHLQVTLH